MKTIVPSVAVRSAVIRERLFQQVRQNMVPKMSIQQKRGLPSTSDVRKEWLYRNKEEEIVQGMGGYPIFLPYTGQRVDDPSETDIDHVVPLAEAMESGAAVWTQARWDQFQSDLGNLMVALPTVNRRYKGSKGVGKWLPPKHRVWYTCDVIEIKLGYHLTFDPLEVRQIALVFAAAARS